MASQRIKPPRIFKDLVKIIKPNAFKEQLQDTSDIVLTSAKLAPTTKKGMGYMFYDNLDNYFTLPGRTPGGRRLKKLIDRQFSQRKKDKDKKIKEEEEERVTVLVPLDDDLKTPATKDLQGLNHDNVLPMHLNFPKRNLGEARKSYTKRTPKKSPPQPLPLITFSKINSTPIVLNPVTSQAMETKTIPRYSLARSKTPIKTFSNKKLGSSIQVEEYITGDPLPMEIEVTQIPQYATEISVDHSGVAISETNSVNGNVLDMSDLIQSPQEDVKLEISSTNLVLCTSVDDMNEVIVMGENGERYRFVALNDGQFSLVAEPTES